MANTKDVLAHIETYEKKIHTSFFTEWNLQKFPFVLLMPDGSFVLYGVDFNTLVVGPTSGNFKELLPIMEAIARKAGLKKLRTTTVRNPKAYARLSGATLVHTEEYPDAPTEYTFELEVTNGRE